MGKTSMTTKALIFWGVIEGRGDAHLDELGALNNPRKGVAVVLIEVGRKYGADVGGS